MPEWQSVVPFRLTPKSFTITVFVIMIMVRLLFVVLGYFLRWWKRLDLSMSGLILDKAAVCLSTAAQVAWSTARRRRSHSDDIEIGVSDMDV